MRSYIGIEPVTGELLRVGVQPNTVSVKVLSKGSTMYIPLSLLVSSGIVNETKESDTPYADYPELEVLDNDGNNIGSDVDRAWCFYNDEVCYRIDGVSNGYYYLKVSAIAGARGIQGIPGVPGIPGKDGDPGKKGDPGTSAGFGQITATVMPTPPGGSPGVSVESTGPDTAKDIHFNFQLSNIDINCTAFEVRATVTDWHKLVLHTDTPKSESAMAESDVVIDWGDGTTSGIAAGDFEKDAIYSNYCDYIFTHSYAPGTYTVKIYGSMYWGISHNVEMWARDYKPGNLMISALSSDLPLAPNVTSLEGFCAHAKQLTSVDIQVQIAGRITTLRRAFTGCTNLKSLTGLGDTTIDINCMEMCNNCVSLEECDAMLPFNSTQSNAPVRMFANCPKLSIDISNIVPTIIVSLGPYHMSATFKGCRNITGTPPAKFLWDSMDILWYDTTDCFTDCTSLDLNNIPKSWGGLKEDTKDFLVQVDWNQGDPNDIRYIRNKPDLEKILKDKAQADWNENDVTSINYIKNKPKVFSSARDLPDYNDIKNVQPDWDQVDTSKPDYIKNKPTPRDTLNELNAVEFADEFRYIQANFSEKDPSRISFIRNKPNILPSSSDYVIVKNIVEIDDVNVVFDDRRPLSDNTTYIMTRPVNSIRIQRSYEIQGETELYFTVADISYTFILDIIKGTTLVGHTQFRNGNRYMISIHRDLAISVCYE